MAMELDHLKIEDAQERRVEIAIRAERAERRQDEERRRLRNQREVRARRKQGTGEWQVVGRQEHGQRRIRETTAARGAQQDQRIAVPSGHFQLSPQQRQELQDETHFWNSLARNMSEGMVPANKREGPFLRSGISSREQLEAARSSQRPPLFRSRADEQHHALDSDLDHIPISYWEDGAGLTIEERRNEAEFLRIQQMIRDDIEMGGTAAATIECAACMEGSPRSEMASLVCGHAYSDTTTVSC